MSNVTDITKVEQQALWSESDRKFHPTSWP
jgi:hypothetical protein